jgi:hypothetical protein
VSNPTQGDCYTFSFIKHAKCLKQSAEKLRKKTALAWVFDLCSTKNKRYGFFSNRERCCSQSVSSERCFRLDVVTVEFCCGTINAIVFLCIK